jgi:hypothetical protein
MENFESKVYVQMYSKILVDSLRESHTAFFKKNRHLACWQENGFANWIKLLKNHNIKNIRKTQGGMKSSLAFPSVKRAYPG